jgi:metallo-beta-lactamase class B
VKPVVLFVVTALSFVQSSSRLQPDPPLTCSACDEWNRPQEPFRIFGNTYYVGVAGLSAVLVTTGGGSILLDGGLPQSAPLIDANVRKLGFKTEDIRLIVNSHAHYDHSGGIAALQRASGAQVAASAAGKRALEQGEPTTDDPQYGFGRQANAFPAVKNVRVVADGETLRVGDLAVTAHMTPGHTPGATTWTWRSCEGSTCYNVVYADSLNAVAAPGFRFTGDRTQPSRIESFRQTIAKVGKLPCDILITVHPGFVDLAGKLKQRAARPAADPFITPDACRIYARDARRRLDARIAEEATGKGSPAR